ncbi:hypothetical protein F5887DRAFT_924423 [Amanita rubescens]|nr:hypothetical protein F5887DRAFT_924423 [Amanita rubescens]
MSRTYRGLQGYLLVERWSWTWAFASVALLLVVVKPIVVFGGGEWESELGLIAELAAPESGTFRVAPDGDNGVGDQCGYGRGVKRGSERRCRLQMSSALRLGAEPLLTLVGCFHLQFIRVAGEKMRKEMNDGGGQFIWRHLHLQRKLCQVQLRCLITTSHGAIDHQRLKLMLQKDSEVLCLRTDKQEPEDGDNVGAKAYQNSSATSLA